MKDLYVIYLNPGDICSIAPFELHFAAGRHLWEFRAVRPPDSHWNRPTLLCVSANNGQILPASFHPVYRNGFASILIVIGINIPFFGNSSFFPARFYCTGEMVYSNSPDTPFIIGSIT